MDNAGRKRQGQKKRFQDIKPSQTIFFIEKKLVRVLHKSISENIIKYYNFIDDKNQTMLYSDFKKHKKRAYTIIDTARLLDKSHIDLNLQAYRGKIPFPVGATPGGVREFRKKSYYSEDQIFEIRRILSRTHRGRPRKDGAITNNTIPSEAELRSRMGDAIMLYTKTQDGQFIPVWSEETW